MPPLVHYKYDIHCSQFFTLPTSEAVWPERAVGGLPEMAGGYLIDDWLLV